MIEALHFIRKAIIDRLTDSIVSNGVSVDVYNRVPSNATEPFIKVYSLQNNELDFNRDSFMLECITRIEVVTAFDSDSGGELQCNQIVSDVLKLVRTRSNGYFDLSSNGFNVYTSVLENTSYFEEDADDKTYFRAVIDLSNKVQQIDPSGGLQSELQNELQS